MEAGRPIRKTLRPCIGESKDWNTTENLYIEGDNLDSLKLLQESYLRKVKMCYIDPPYNTGTDSFVYRDKFTMDEDEYDEAVEMHDENGLRNFRENSVTNPRYHSSWCTSIYPTLVLARNLLSDDGVIFISIDDNELHNFKKICDEIYGAGNFISQISWVSKSGGSADERFIINRVEYILVYAKNISTVILGKQLQNIEDGKYALKDAYEAFRGKYTLKKLDYRMTSAHYTESLNYPIIDPDGKELWPGGESFRQDGGWNWRWGKVKVQWGFENDFLVFTKGKNRKWVLSSKQYQKVDNNNQSINRAISYSNLILSTEFNTTQGSRLVVDFFGSKIFEYAKPVGLLSRLISIANLSSNGIVLDFFSGSATTAHAVMQLNAEDGGQRKFIMVQLPESCDEKSEASKEGYKNICEIGKERIRRAGDKIKSENKDKAGIENLDVGFRVLKLDDTNMKDVYYAAGSYTQDLLSLTESNIKEDRTDMDLLYGCLLDWGLPLSQSHNQEEIDGCIVHTYNGGDLMACFAEKVSETLVKEIAKRKPIRVVFRDSSFSSSHEKINVEEIFKLMAPNTTVKVI